MRKVRNYDGDKKRLLAITATAITVMLVVSVGIIGAAPLSVQQQGREQAPGQSVTSSNIVDGEVTNQDLADNAVTTEKIEDGQVTTQDLADDAITSGKIEDGAVTSEDVADGAITSSDIAEGTIPPTSGIPDDNSVTSAKIVDGAITSSDIGDGQVTSQDLANGAITRSDIANGAVQLTVRTVFEGFGGDLGPNGFAKTRAVCQAGEIVTGGGFAGDIRLDIAGSFPEGNGWSVVAQNPTPDSLPFGAYAMCARITP